MTKTKLFKKFEFEPEQNLREQLWEIMADNRKKSVEEVKYLKNVRPIEVIALKIFYGVGLNEDEERLMMLSKKEDFLKKYM